MSKSRVNEIDLLRFLAALAVVLYHYCFRGYAADHLSRMPYPLLASGAKYGYLGVELFFIISGFVILMSAGNGSLRSFFVSRFVRLYPAFWACCTITFLVTLSIGGTRFSAGVSQYLVNMSMLSGFLGVPSIDGAYWSLFVEMRFYVLVAVVLLFGRIHRAQWFLMLWLLATTISLFSSSSKVAFLVMSDYSPYFIAGATFYLIWSDRLSVTRGVMILLSWCLALRQSLNALAPFESHYHTIMSRPIVATTITVFFLLMLLISLKATGSLGLKRWGIAGSLTYPLYLLHQNIGFMVFNTLFPAVNAHLVLWGTIGAVLVAAYAVHHIVERRLSSPLKDLVSLGLDLLNNPKKLGYAVGPVHDDA